MEPLLEKTIMEYCPLCAALERVGILCLQHLSGVFSFGGVGISLASKITNDDVDRDVWIFLGHFQEKMVKVVVIMEGVAHMCFIGGSMVGVTVLSKKSIDA